MAVSRKGGAAERPKAAASGAAARPRPAPCFPANRKLAVPDGTGHWRLRVWSWRGTRTKMARVLIKCGDCDELVEICYDHESLEINDVIASIDEWRRVLGPLLEAGKRREA